MPDYELQELETKCDPKLNATQINVAEAPLDHFDHSGLLKADQTTPLMRRDLTKPGQLLEHQSFSFLISSILQMVLLSV